jgi:hypothetical protein
MRKYRTFVLVVPLLFGLATLFVIQRPRAQEQTASTTTSLSRRPKKTIDVTKFPIADFSTAVPTDAKRKERGKKRDNSNWAVHPNATSDSTVVVDSVDTTLLGLPVEKAAAVITGVVSDAKAYLSNDKSGVYSSFSVIIDDVLKNPGRLAVGQTIEIEREGGRVRFPSGRLHLYMVAEQDMPHTGSRYVFFLAKTEEDFVFEVITGYEIRGDRVYSLDELPQTRSYDGTSAATFLQELRRQLTDAK